MTSISTIKKIQEKSEISYTQDCVDIYYVASYGFIKIYWKRFATEEQYREAMEVAFRIIQERGARSWVSDMTHAGVVSVENQQWMKKIFIPQAIKAGIEKVAIIVSSDIFNRMFTDEIVKLLGSGMCRYFYDTNEAEKWALS